MMALETELGQQRIAELRALARDTKPGTVITPDFMALQVRSPWVEPWVMLPARELLAMLDRLDAHATEGPDRAAAAALDEAMG